MSIKPKRLKGEDLEAFRQEQHRIRIEQKEKKFALFKKNFNDIKYVREFIRRNGMIPVWVSQLEKLKGPTYKIVGETKVPLNTKSFDPPVLKVVPLSPKEKRRLELKAELMALEQEEDEEQPETHE